LESAKLRKRRETKTHRRHIPYQTLKKKPARQKRKSSKWQNTEGEQEGENPRDKENGKKLSERHREPFYERKKEKRRKHPIARSPPGERKPGEKVEKRETRLIAEANRKQTTLSTFFANPQLPKGGEKTRAMTRSRQRIEVNEGCESLIEGKTKRMCKMKGRREGKSPP